MKATSTPTNPHLRDPRHSSTLIRADRDYNYAVRTLAGVEKFLNKKNAAKAARSAKANGQDVVMNDVFGNVFYYWNSKKGIFQTIL